MVFWPLQPWYIETPAYGISKPLSMVYGTPYPWYIEPSASSILIPYLYGISNSIPMVYLTSIHDILNHLPIVYRTLYIWYFKPPCSWYIGASICHMQGFRYTMVGEVKIPWIRDSIYHR
jgi:hypothetical protein